MNDWVTAQHEVSFRTRRCPKCGSFWAIEQMNQYGCTCPVCAERLIVEARSRADKAERAVAALRGALKRAKRRKA